MLIGFLIGFYIAMTVCYFFLFAICYSLGGKSSDLWKVVVYSIFWPIFAPLIVTGKIR
jgi:hypothetical protein